MPKGIHIAYSSDEHEFIHAHCQLPRIELTALFNATFGRDLRLTTIAALCKREGWLTGRDGRRKKGDKAWNKGVTGYMGANKTSFKKGDRVHNHKPLGYERISKDGYIEIKVAEPGTFKLKHRVVYEQHYGELPVGHIVRFKDGNRLNLDPNNLVAITRSANQLLTQKYKHHAAHDEVKPVLITMAQIDAKIAKLNKMECER